MITKEMLTEVCGPIKLSAYRSVSADLESKLQGLSKQIEFEVDFEGASLRSIFDKAFGAAYITYANGQGRKNIDKLAKKVSVKFTAPARRVETREEKVNKYRGMGLTQDLAELAVDNPEKFAELVNKVGTAE